MTQTIKAIETSYKGYRFRSRLEARWAVFFDAAGVVWDYETQGFTSQGESYLPDFELPKWEIFLEIKPHSTAFMADMYRTKTAMKGKSVVALVGNPWPWEYCAWRLENDGWNPHPTAQFASCDACKEPQLIISSFDANERMKILDGYCGCESGSSWDRPCLKWNEVWNPYSEARSARFEHGESGGRPQTSKKQAFQEADLVEHPQYGRGYVYTVIGGNGDSPRITVRFDDGSQRMFTKDAPIIRVART